MNSKKEWQKAARIEMLKREMGYKELAEKTGLKLGTVSQCMVKDKYPKAKDIICKYLGV